MSEPFSYPASDHAEAEADISARGESRAAPPGTEAPQFSYDKTDQPLPQGAPDLPEAVRSLREQDEARQMFSPQLDYRDSGLEEAFTLPEITEELRAAVVGEYKEIFADHGMSTNEAREVVSLARELTANPPDEATEATWQGEAWQRLVETNGGPKGAKEALELAQRLVARDPRVAHILEVTRLGNHPKMVELMVAKARSEKARGRLRG